ncbi:MAG: hypothetical protein R3228_12615, partial [Halioglobus sp.]|nr:hypothetical protein [Halioglobus sp.]
MSIIEKAVNALGKGEEAQETKKQEVSRQDAAPESASAVERAGGAAGADARQDVEAEAQKEAKAQIQQKPKSVARPSHTTSIIHDAESIVRDKYIKLNFEELRQAGMLTPNVPRSAIAEEFRTIKRP